MYVYYLGSLIDNYNIFSEKKESELLKKDGLLMKNIGFVFFTPFIFPLVIISYFFSSIVLFFKNLINQNKNERNID